MSIPSSSSFLGEGGDWIGVFGSQTLHWSSSSTILATSLDMSSRCDGLQWRLVFVWRCRRREAEAMRE